MDQIITIYGSYDNYLNCLTHINVNDDFMMEYYPEFIEDVKFKILLNSLDSIVIRNVDFILKLYKQINTYNELSQKIIVYKEYVNKEIIEEMVNEIRICRNEIASVIKEIGADSIDINELLYNINKKVKKRIILESTLNFNENKSILLEESDFVEL